MNNVYLYVHIERKNEIGFIGGGIMLFRGINLQKNRDITMTSHYAIPLLAKL